MDFDTKDDEIIDNRILLISEIKGKVFLPYFVDDLNKTLSLNGCKYTTIKDLINAEYIKPIEQYKNPVLSRFKEAYSLMKHKEKASLPDCLNLAIELSFNSLLNPAIISACKNLDELDIYLDYLSTNELEKFKIFEIKYEFAPVIIS